MENKTNKNLQVNSFKQILTKHLKKGRQKKEAIKKLPKIKRVTYYTKDLFIQSCLAFVYDFVLRVLFQWAFFHGKLPESVLSYFVDYIFVKYGFYYTIIWIVALVAFINYILRKDKNVKIFYFSWIALLIICVSQILIDLHLYLNFLKLVFTFNIVKLFELFSVHSFQLEIFALIWSIKNIFRFIYVSSSMAKFKIQISEIEDEEAISKNIKSTIE